MQTAKAPSLTTQTLWLIVARTLGFFFSFALPLVLSRILRPTDLGIYRQAFLILTTAINILPLGMHSSAFYYLAGPPDSRPKAVLNITVFMAIMGLLGGGLLMLWPGVLAFISADALIQYGRLLGLLIFFWTVSSFLEVVATAGQDVAWSTRFIILSQLTKTACIGSAAITFRTVEAVLYAALVQGIIQTVVLFWYVNRTFPGVWRTLDTVLIREQTSYAIPFGLATIMYTAQADFHSYLVAANVPPAQYAVYSIGTAQLPLVNLLRDSLNSVLLSRISGLQQEGRLEDIRNLVFRSVRKVFAFYLPVWAGLLLVGRELITTLYTARYIDSWPIFAINIMLFPFNGLLSDAVLRSFPTCRFRALAIRIAVVVLTIAFCLAGFHTFGMIGAVSGATSGMILERVCLFLLGMKVIGTRRSDLLLLSDVPKLILATALAYGAGFIIRILCSGLPAFAVLVISGSVFAAVFGAAVLWMNILDNDERELINARSRRLLGRNLLVMTPRQISTL